MIDPPPLMEVLEAIFGTKDFCSTGAGGGDYNSECTLPAILSARLTQPLLPTAPGVRASLGLEVGLNPRLVVSHHVLVVEARERRQ